MTSIGSPAAAASPTRPWPAERVEQWPIERLIPYADNPRLHSAADIERIAALHPEMGVDQPGPGGRTRRADRRSRPGRRRGEVGADDTDPGDRRARLERGGETGLSPGRQ